MANGENVIAILDTHHQVHIDSSI